MKKRYLGEVFSHRRKRAFPHPRFAPFLHFRPLSYQTGTSGAREKTDMSPFSIYPTNSEGGGRDFLRHFRQNGDKRNVRRGPADVLNPVAAVSCDRSVQNVYGTFPHTELNALTVGIHIEVNGVAPHAGILRRRPTAHRRKPRIPWCPGAGRSGPRLPRLHGRWCRRRSGYPRCRRWCRRCPA